MIVNQPLINRRAPLNLDRCAAKIYADGIKDEQTVIGGEEWSA